MIAVSAMKDIRRLYGYHGAEHKCINCIESGQPLTVDNVMRSSRFHKRCGSSFIVLILVISVILFFFIRVDSFGMRILVRIAMIPLIAGISFEFLRYAGRQQYICQHHLGTRCVASAHHNQGAGRGNGGGCHCFGGGGF